MNTAAEPRMYSQRHLDRGSVDLEQRITSSIRELVSTRVGRDRLRHLREMQLTFFLTAIKRIYYNEDREETYSDYLSLIDNLVSKTDFACDAANFKNIDFSRGLVVITGHFGITKATKITKMELTKRLQEKASDTSWLQQVNAPPNDEPFPLRTAAVWKTLFEVLGKKRINPHEVHMWYPYPFGEIQKDCGVVGIYLDRSSQYSVMEKNLDELFSADIAAGKVPVALIFPEPGTTGKRTESGNPYELGAFKAGFAAYAAHASVPIVPVVQVVGKNAELRAKVLRIIESPKSLTKEAIRDFVASVRKNMQREIEILCQTV